MMGWSTGGMDAGVMVMMMFALAALIGTAVWAAAALTRPRQPPAVSSPDRESAQDVLDRRLAVGEITADEYLAVRSALDVYVSTPRRAA